MMKCLTLTILVINLFSSAQLLKLQKTTEEGNQMLHYGHDYFLGQWKAYGYTCDKYTPKEETVNIDHVKGGYVATKVLGDNCVKSNTVTFTTGLQKSFHKNQKVKATFTLGSVKKPNSAMRILSIDIIDKDNFKSVQHNHTIYFKRSKKIIRDDDDDDEEEEDKDGPGGKKNGEFNHIYMTPLVNENGKYKGPKIIKLNPHKGKPQPVARFVVVEERTQEANCKK